MAKLITVSENLLEDILPHLKGTPLEKKVNDLIENTGNIDVDYFLKDSKIKHKILPYVPPMAGGKVPAKQGSYFPKEAKVERIVDGDTVVLHSGTIVRYVGITSPETNEPYEKEATEANRKLVEGKEVKLEYDNYKGDKFGRILAYLIVDGKNISTEMARLGMAQVVIYQHKKPFIYIDELLKAQEEAKKNKLGIWSQ